MALQAQLHLELPTSSSDLSGPGSAGPSSLPYTLNSGSNAYDRSPPHHFNSRTSSNQVHRNKSHDLLPFPFGTHQHNSWSTSTSQPGEGPLCDATTATTHSSISGGTLSSDAVLSGSFNRSSAQHAGLLSLRSGSFPSTSVGQSMHVTTTPMASIAAPAQESYHHAYGNGAYGSMDFTTTPTADSEASQGPSTAKTTPMPHSFSPQSLLRPATNCPVPPQVAVSALGQPYSSALAPGIAAGTSSVSESSTRTSIASTSSTANTPLTPITPLTPVSTTAIYSSNISAPSNDVSGGLLPMRGSNSLPTLSNDVDINENYMSFHPDIKARMHSVSLPTPSLAVNGNTAQGLSPHNIPASMPALGHPGSAMTAGPTSTPLPTRHISLPSLPQDYRTSQPYSTQLGSLTASIHHASSDHHAKHAAAMRSHVSSTEAPQAGATLGLSLGANSPGLDHSISQGTTDLAPLGQRSLPSGLPSHPHLAYGMPPYTAGRSMMDHGMGLGMNMNLGLGSSAFSSGTSTAAAAAAAAMAMGTGHPGNAGRTATSTTSSGTSKKHKCKVCDKRFTRPSSLQTHMYSHTGEKPFTCDFDSCGRQFSVVSNLRRHKKVHKGVTPPSQANGGTSPSLSR